MSVIYSLLGDSILCRSLSCDDRPWVVVSGIAFRSSTAEPPYDRDVSNIIAVINPAI